MEPEINFEPFTQAERMPSSLPWAVYRAEDSRSGHTVRLSVLWATDHMAPERMRAALDWFAEAGYQAQRLTSPTIPAVLSYKSTEAAAYVATDFPSGFSVRERIEMDGAWPVPRAMHLSSLLAGALAKVHSVGWAHGWLNPETVWVNDTDTLTVTDLGLGLAAQSIVPGSPAPFNARPGFLSGDPLRRDLQCLGLLLTLMLTGRLPDPVGVPRGDVFPDELPGGVVQRIRNLINPQVENPMTAAQWADFARVGQAPEEAEPEGDIDRSYYEAPGRAGGRLGQRPWSRLGLYAGGAAVLVAAVAAGNALMASRDGANPPAPPTSRSTATSPVRPGAAPSTPSQPTTVPAAPVTPADTLTKVQVGPIEPAQVEATAARLKGMGFDPYIRRESGQIFFQVGAFASTEGAQSTQDQLKRAGLPVRVQ